MILKNSFPYVKKARISIKLMINKKVVIKKEIPCFGAIRGFIIMEKAIIFTEL